MPIPFTLVCNFLDQCHRLGGTRKSIARFIIDWFSRHRLRIEAHDTDLAALLSTMLPEKRTDRVYCIKSPTLEKLIGRALMLGSSRLIELGLYKRPGQGNDLGDCVERILNATPNPTCNEQEQITVEEVDEILDRLASAVKWSSPSVRDSHNTICPRRQCVLTDVYRRLSALEAKWFTRLVLKDYKPLVLDSELIYGCCDASLPVILKVQEDFATAIETLQTMKNGKSCAGPVLMKGRHLTSVRPKIGVKVGRQPWIKGRSIKNCLDMGHGLMSVESKIDGEYCQIHVQLVNGEPRLQIFSKSGKDSTEDRCKLHGAILKSLGLGPDSSDSSVRKGCILEGELVVHDDSTNKVLPFHKIRNHVARRGRFINVDLDSPPKSHENLMIVFYDILLLDEQSLLGVRHSERWKTLQKLIRCERGRAELVGRKLVDFNRPTAASALRKAFADVITARGEGLVLKPDEPYFDLEGRNSRTSGFCIKLKKEYIGTFGDVGDFAVIGAGFSPAKARSYKIPKVRWTVFYMGCLNNREEVRRWNAKPDLTAVCAVELSEQMLRTLSAHWNPVPVPLSSNDKTRLHIPRGVQVDAAPLTVAFQNPPIFDLRCFSFDKPGNVGFWTLRFPVVSKIHFDRDFAECVSFAELQQMARQARAAPGAEESQENLEWIARLEGADPRGRAVDAVSQLTATTMPTPSPCRSNSPAFSSIRSSSKSGSPEWAKRSQQNPKLMTPRIAGAKASEGGAKHKPCRAPKRRASASPGLSPSKKTRQPLTDLRPNVSQSPAAPLYSAANETEDEWVPTKASLPLAQHTRYCDASHEGTCHGAEAQNPSAETSPTSQDVLPHRLCEKKGGRGGCRFAGDKCRLSGYSILLASAALSPSLERLTLLDAHALGDAVFDMDGWLGKDCLGVKSGCKSHDRVIVLVDTIEKADETRLVLAAAERARRGMPSRTRSWIAVYDWRVLEYIRILEDKDTKKKYFDGFHDPWRRWYCGIV